MGRVENLKPTKAAIKLPTIQQAMAWRELQLKDGKQDSCSVYIVIFESPKSDAETDEDTAKKNYKYNKSLVAIKSGELIIPTRSVRENKAQISSSISASISRIARSAPDVQDIRLLRVAHDWKIPGPSDFPEVLLQAIEHAVDQL
ncbi:MAG: hypothetical protein IBX50_17900 [Marinospirillum sp.]|uniref:hypothetical protein n=1 Tax=Marinospirillum sp. TaxID=2183934 RepID=UPI0019DB41B1|nr:hypothetical protein [Marinospirillum sp.]MBE0507812.1 hypothetical protein [Marinospirillum sp.]MBE0508562.1 hypothetical protein [Marinospirillum sp.]